MATNFPTSLDSYSTVNNGDTITNGMFNNPQDAIEALEAKVGVDGSADTDSLDYKVGQRALAARTISAGSGLSGGGDLSADRTLTLADDGVTPAKCSPGALMAASHCTEVIAGNTSYAEKLFFSFKCPSGPTILRGYARLKNSIATVKNSYALFTVTGLGSSAGNNKTGNTYGWLDIGTIDVSGLTPGTVYELTVSMKADSSSNAYLEGLSIWWE